MNVIHVVLYDNPTKSQKHQIIDQKTDPKGVDSQYALERLRAEVLNCLKQNDKGPESELRPLVGDLISRIFDLARKRREPDDKLQEHLQIYRLDTGSFLCVTWLDQSELAHDRAKRLTHEEALKIWARRFQP